MIKSKFEVIVHHINAWKQGHLIHVLAHVHYLELGTEKWMAIKLLKAKNL